MTQEFVGERFDDEGNPTPQAIEHLRCLRGSPCEFVAFATSIWDDHGSVSVDHVPAGANQGALHRVHFATGGSAGNEQIVSTIRRSLFHVLFWASTHRGGTFVYEIPADSWTCDEWDFSPASRRPPNTP